VDVRLKNGLAGSRKLDNDAADEAAGFTKDNPRPKDHTWHHHQDEGRMILVPSDVHEKTHHSGGRHVYKTRTGKEYQ
jgi:hypothetical protein